MNEQKMRFLMSENGGLTTQAATVFFVLMIFQFPIVLYLYRSQTLQNGITYSYTSEYYNKLESELIGQAWNEIQNRPNQDQNVESDIMRKIKQIIKSFVRKLEVNDDGIADEEEFKSVVYYIINFIDPNFEPKEINEIKNVIPPSKEKHRYNSALEECPEKPPKLVGYLDINFNHDAPSSEQLANRYSNLKEGGRFTPDECRPVNRVAIVIPYRNRDEHLRYFLEYMHAILQRQQLEYQIFIVNQVGEDPFNRAKLLNVGFMEALKLYDWQCFVFHDVDLVLENDKCLYRCPEMPRHISVAVDKFNYRLPYYSIFGGITSLSVDHMIALNGYSNKYWGWGGEDDDMYQRIKWANYKISRPQPKLARFKMIKHLNEKKNAPNMNRFNLLKHVLDRMPSDGINSLKYRVMSIDLLPTHTMINVDLLYAESEAKGQAISNMPNI